jgi:predicted transcriptional regulator YheO
MGSVQRSEDDKLHPIMEALKANVADLQKAIGPHCEVVLRDLCSEGKPIIAIAGTTTNRQIGDPPTGMMYQWLRSGSTNESHLNYSGRTSDGRIMRSSTLFFRDEHEKLIGCLCINLDITDLVPLPRWLSAYCDTKGIMFFAQESTEIDAGTALADGIENVLLRTIDDVIEQMAVRPEAMRKTERVQVIRRLDNLGVFALKNAKEVVAARLGVSKAAVYNYLKECR